MATVLQVSDTHLRAKAHTPIDKDPDSALRASIDAARQIPVDLVLLTGDLADDGSLAALRRVRDIVAVLKAPVLAVAGNHDEIGNVHSVFGMDDVAEVGSWRVLTVESVVPGHEHGSVDVDQLTRRLDRLDGRPTLIALHHPPRSSSTHPWFQLIGAEQMMAELRVRPNVHAVVSGHLHQAFDRRDGDLQLWGSPSTYYAIEHDGDGYRLIDHGVVGTQLLTLDDDGSISCERLARSLGC